MRYFELICTAYLKKDINFRESFEKIARYINYSMAQIEKFEKLHKENRFKHYVFNSFYPIENDEIYKKGKNYIFRIRSLNYEFIEMLQESLRRNINNPNFIVVTTEKKSFKQFFISELYSLTPTIITMKNGKFWTIKESGDIIKLYNQLQSNLERKYLDFFNEKLEVYENFIQLLEIKNRKPQNIQLTKNGKTFRLFGNKFKIIPRDDGVSQKLAFVALSSGLGEKNSFGGGFCSAK